MSQDMNKLYRCVYLTMKSILFVSHLYITFSNLVSSLYTRDAYYEWILTFCSLKVNVKHLLFWEYYQFILPISNITKEMYFFYYSTTLTSLHFWLVTIWAYLTISIYICLPSLQIFLSWQVHNNAFLFAERM